MIRRRSSRANTTTLRAPMEQSDRPDLEGDTMHRNEGIHQTQPLGSSSFERYTSMTAPIDEGAQVTEQEHTQARLTISDLTDRYRV